MRGIDAQGQNQLLQTFYCRFRPRKLALISSCVKNHSMSCVLWERSFQKHKNVSHDNIYIQQHKSVVQSVVIPSKLVIAHW